VTRWRRKLGCSGSIPSFANTNPGADRIFLGGRMLRPTSPLPVITDGTLTLVGLG
jgi:hypothetical protein